MKKLGLIFVVFLYIFLGTYVEKTYSAVSGGEISAIAEESKQAIRSVPGIVNIGNKYPQFLIQVDTIVKEYSSSGDSSSDSYYAAAAKINRSIGQYLAGQTGSSNYIVGVEMTARNNDAVVGAFAAINNLYILYDSNEKVRTGALTAEESQKRIESRALTNANLSKPIAEVNKNKPDSCGGITDVWCYVQKSLVNFIKIFLLNIAGFLLWVSANMLNYSIKVGILDFARWAPDTLYPIWIVVRQIVSLFVVFAGLYLGLMYIIGKDEKFEKYIPWVVIFALFVNFSYPLARTAIDVSNIVSLNIYAGAVGSNALTAEISSRDTAGSIIMQRLGLEKLVTSATENNASTDMITGISSPAGALMAIIFVLFSAYIFFMVTWLLIARTAVLIFLTIASPILFVDSVIPKLGDVAMKLRKMFVEQLFVGPVFMIMLALTLKFLQVFNLSRSGSSGTAAASDATIVEFFNITMMLIMLHIMRKVTMSTAGSIGETVSGYMGKVGGFAVGGATGLAMGGAGILARGTMGRAAAALRDSKWVTNNQNGVLGRHAYNMTNSIAKSSFDARNSSYVQTGAKKLGLGLGMGSNTNYEKSVDARVQDRKERYLRIKTENPDGTINQEGAEAKRRFHENAGGSLFNKKEVQKALLEEDVKATEAQDKKLTAYDKRSGEEKQNYYKNEKDQAMKQQMIDHDRAQAEKEDKVHDEVEKILKTEQENKANQEASSKIDWSKVTVEGATPNSSQKTRAAVTSSVF